MSDELVWAYCVASAGTRVATAGIGGAPTATVEEGDLAAVVGRVPRDEFAEDALRQNLNDLRWLADVARAHERVLEHVLRETTIVPLRLCTIYEDEDGVREMLKREDARLATALTVLTGREEWGVKLVVDKKALADVVQETSGEAAAMAAEAEGKSDAGAYLIRRRLERHVRETADTLAAAAADELHAGLNGCVLAVVTRPPQNPELSGHTGSMLLNAACLVDHGGAERLRALAEDFEAHYARLGAHVDVTGPWPPYNFVPGEDSVAAV